MIFDTQKKAYFRLKKKKKERVPFLSRYPAMSMSNHLIKKIPPVHICKIKTIAIILKYLLPLMAKLPTLKLHSDFGSLKSSRIVISRSHALNFE